MGTTLTATLRGQRESTYLRRQFCRARLLCTSALSQSAGRRLISRAMRVEAYRPWAWGSWRGRSTRVMEKGGCSDKMIVLGLAFFASSSIYSHMRLIFAVKHQTIAAPIPISIGPPDLRYSTRTCMHMQAGHTVPPSHAGISKNSVHCCKHSINIKLQLLPCLVTATSG